MLCKKKSVLSKEMYERDGRVKEDSQHKRAESETIAASLILRLI